MSLKNQYTTADYIEWDFAMNLVRQLYRDGNYRFSLLIGCGCFFGLRYSDLKTLRWDQLITSDVFTLTERKTGKRRDIRINKGFQQHIKDCHDALKIKDDAQPCFLTRFGSVLSVQMANRHFKNIKARYKVKIKNFSTHSLRKTFGRRVVEMAGADAEMALIKLSEIFNHSSPMVTRRYLGLRQEELREIYENLSF